MIMRRIKSVIGIQADTESNLKKFTLGCTLFYLTEIYVDSHPLPGNSDKASEARHGFKNKESFSSFNAKALHRNAF